jgi:hypothetical protein
MVMMRLSVKRCNDDKAVSLYVPRGSSAFCLGDLAVTGRGFSILEAKEKERKVLFPVFELSSEISCLIEGAIEFGNKNDYEEGVIVLWGDRIGFVAFNNDGLCRVENIAEK